MRFDEYLQYDNGDEWVCRTMNRTAYFLKFLHDDRVRMIKEKGNKPDIIRVLVQRKNEDLLNETKYHSLSEFF